MIEYLKDIGYPFQLDKSYAAAFILLPTFNGEPLAMFAFEGPNSSMGKVIPTFCDKWMVKSIVKRINYNSVIDLGVDLMDACYIDAWNCIHTKNHHLTEFAIHRLIDTGYVSEELWNDKSKHTVISNLDTLLIAEKQAVAVGDDTYYSLKALSSQSVSHIQLQIPNYNAYYYKKMTSSADPICKVLNPYSEPHPE